MKKVVDEKVIQVKEAIKKFGEETVEKIVTRKKENRIFYTNKKFEEWLQENYKAFTKKELKILKFEMLETTTEQQETESQKVLDKLINIAKNERYYDTSKETIEKLKQEFQHSVDRDMNLFREEIISFLTEQFLQRYYYLEGFLQYRSKHDKEILKAAELLANQDEYNKILHP